eukprot:CAMPEP_0174843448 /NCGR_PEP_ID=MMETSP1114-20130205/10535_1 /TAXON_ID=312471 /ORGANISM="Neobodo designis, Strain CCAP 1951/1" /LENGTH=368 /DNA_ID=CAMNT_0016077673 /DNA_START=30 /DNA_END=1136 /DNA_ORIENTATION=+
MAQLPAVTKNDVPRNGFIAAVGAGTLGARRRARTSHLNGCPIRENIDAIRCVDRVRDVGHRRVPHGWTRIHCQQRQTHGNFADVLARSHRVECRIGEKHDLTGARHSDGFANARDGAERREPPFLGDISHRCFDRHPRAEIAQSAGGGDCWTDDVEAGVMRAEDTARHIADVNRTAQADAQLCQCFHEERCVADRGGDGGVRSIGVAFERDAEGAGEDHEVAPRLDLLEKKTALEEGVDDAVSLQEPPLVLLRAGGARDDKLEYIDGHDRSTANVGDGAGSGVEAAAHPAHECGHSVPRNDAVQERALRVPCYFLLGRECLGEAQLDEGTPREGFEGGKDDSHHEERDEGLLPVALPCADAEDHEARE